MVHPPTMSNFWNGLFLMWLFFHCLAHLFFIYRALFFTNFCEKENSAYYKTYLCQEQYLLIFETAYCSNLFHVCCFFYFLFFLFSTLPTTYLHHHHHFWLHKIWILAPKISQKKYGYGHLLRWHLRQWIWIIWNCQESAPTIKTTL